MEVAVEAEDDVFFADLSKQISLLIMDDEEDLVTHSPSVSLQQAFSQAIHPAPQLPFLHEQTSRRGQSKGTGVFIPRSLNPRRKNRQGRYNSSSNVKFHRHSDNLRGFPQVPQTSRASYNDSFNPRRLQ